MLFVKKFIIDTLRNCIKFIAVSCCECKWDQDVMGQDVREPIGSYWESLTGDDQKIWYASEIYSKFRFQISSVEDDALENLRTKDRRKADKIDGKKPQYIEGDSRYDILSNLNYQQEFQYISVE